MMNVAARGLRLKLAVLLLSLGAVAPSASAAVLSISYRALEQAVERTLFLEEARYYLFGSPKSKCAYAYLEEPEISPADDRLRIRVHFSNRNAKKVFGKCVGPGEAFHAEVTGIPAFIDGEIMLADLQVEVPANPFYSLLIRQFLTDRLAQFFRYPLALQIAAMVQNEGDRGTVDARLSDLEISEIELAEEALVIRFDFQVRVD